MKELKICPFCGAIPSIKKGNTMFFCIGYRIVCPNCGAGTRIENVGYHGINENAVFYTDEMIIDKLLSLWNNRTA